MSGADMFALRDRTCSAGGSVCHGVVRTCCLPPRNAGSRHLPGNLEAEMSHQFGRFYIDGEWAAPLSETVRPVVEAATEEHLSDLPEAGAKDVDRAVAAARRAQSGWAATDPARRAELMESLADAVERRSAKISEWVSRQNGMPLAFSAMANVRAMAGTLRYYAGLARTALADEVRPALSYPGAV